MFLKNEVEVIATELNRYFSSFSFIIQINGLSELSLIWLFTSVLNSVSHIKFNNIIT